MWGGKLKIKLRITELAFTNFIVEETLKVVRRTLQGSAEGSLNTAVLDDSGLDSRQRHKIFSSPQHKDLSPGSKRLELSTLLYLKPM